LSYQTTLNIKLYCVLICALLLVLLFVGVLPLEKIISYCVILNSDIKVEFLIKGGRWAIWHEQSQYFVLYLWRRLVLMFFLYLCDVFVDVVWWDQAWLACWVSTSCSGNNVKVVDNEFEMRGLRIEDEKWLSLLMSSHRPLVTRAVQLDLLVMC